MTLEKKDIEFITRLISTYVKDKKRYPTLKTLVEYNSTNPIGAMISPLEKDDKFQKEYTEILLESFRDTITSKSSVKTKQLVKDSYLNNKELFEEFFLINLDRSNTSKSSFNEVGLKIQWIISTCADQLVGKMESGKKFGVFSSSVWESFFTYIKTFFPYYDHIWVVVRKV